MAQSDIDTARMARRSRITILMLAAVFVVPLVIAVVMWKLVDVRSLGTTNYGQLVEPARPLRESRLTRNDGSAFILDDLRGKWTLLYIVEGACDEACRNSIHQMRQVRWAQGEEMHRVQRLCVFMEAGQMDAARLLLVEYPGMLVVSGAPTEVGAFVSQFDAADGSPARSARRVYIVDPIGNLMMRYPPDSDPRALFEDLKKLLKLSQIG